MTERFEPPPWVANPHLQSFLASARLRRMFMDVRALRATSQEVLLDCGAGVRLQAFQARPPDTDAATPVAVLLHGWEGSVDSPYVLSAASVLLREGVEVVRVNLRDHGGTHHLNEDLFHSCRLDEVVGAVAAITRARPGRPVTLAGWSLGANFAVRVTRRAQDAGIDLTHTFAVSPPLDPGNSYLAMQRGLFVYQRYFLHKWKRSLRRKQAVFPNRYDFSEVLGMTDLREMTARLIGEFTGFATVDDYFRGYALTRDMLEGTPTPLTIITAADDPVIPVSDFHHYRSGGMLALEVHGRGGHCGFMDRLGAHSWLDGRLLGIVKHGAGTHA